MYMFVSEHVQLGIGSIGCILAVYKIIIISGTSKPSAYLDMYTYCVIITRLLKDNFKCLVNKQPKTEDKKK